MLQDFRQHIIRSVCSRAFRRSAATPLAFVIGLSAWKNFINDWFQGQPLKRYGRNISLVRFYSTVAPRILANPQSKVYVWAFKHPKFVENFCKRWNVPLVRVEDGFIRSVALGATRAPPLSLCFDSSSLYFDATRASDLERIIQNFDFDADPELLSRARRGVSSLVSSRLSKYNVSADADVNLIYGPKARKRILVLGQVEDDASIAKGCEKPITNNDLVRIAVQENPDAQVIYKPHPEVLHGTRPAQSNPDDVRSIAMVLDHDISLSDSLNTVDHVYTITSLSGFEALLRGIHVTCIGMPFYAGWGATDDRQVCDRRTAKRSVEEIFAAAYILYARYFDPFEHRSIVFEEALELLATMKSKSAVA